MRFNYRPLLLNKVQTVLKPFEFLTNRLHLILVTVLKSFSSFGWLNGVTGILCSRSILSAVPLLTDIRKWILSCNLIAALSAVHLKIFLMGKINGANVGVSIRDVPIFIRFLPFTIRNRPTKDHLMLFMGPANSASIGHNIIPRVSFTLTRICQLVLTLKHDSRVLLERSQDDARWMHQVWDLKHLNGWIKVWSHFL